VDRPAARVKLANGKHIGKHTRRHDDIYYCLAACFPCISLLSSPLLVLAQRLLYFSSRSYVLHRNVRPKVLSWSAWLDLLDIYCTHIGRSISTPTCWAHFAQAYLARHGAVHKLQTRESDWSSWGMHSGRCCVARNSIYYVLALQSEFISPCMHMHARSPTP
jgi:hypothetical protein